MTKITEDLNTTLDRHEVMILKGTFPYVRLCTTDPMDKPIVSAKKTKGKPDLLRMHWNFIRQKIERELEPGTYVLECAYDAARKNVHSYMIVKPKDYQASDNGQPLPPLPNLKQTSYANDLKDLKMTPDKIFELVRENAELKAENKFLSDNNKQLGDKVRELQAELLEMTESLDDEEKPSDAERLLASIRGIMPDLLPMADRFMNYKEKELQMKYGKPRVLPNPGNATNEKKQIPRKRAAPQQQQQVMSLEEQAMLLGQMLDGTDEQNNEAQAILDELERVDPNRYATLCEMLELSEDEEEQQQ